MVTTKSTTTKVGKRAHKTAVRTKLQPRSLKVAAKGVKTGRDFADMMSALMSDLIEGRVAPSVGNATCNAGGKLLKVVELQYRYGTPSDKPGEKTLQLSGQITPPSIKS